MTAAAPARRCTWAATLLLLLASLCAAAIDDGGGGVGGVGGAGTAAASATASSCPAGCVCSAAEVSCRNLDLAEAPLEELKAAGRDWSGVAKL